MSRTSDQALLQGILPEPDPAYQTALKLWLICFIACEMWDRAQPGSWSKHSSDEWIPKAGINSSFARDALRHLLLEAESLKLPKDVVEQAKADASWMNFTEHRRVLKYILLREAENLK